MPACVSNPGLCQCRHLCRACETFMFGCIVRLFARCQRSFERCDTSLGNETGKLLAGNASPEHELPRQRFAQVSLRHGASARGMDPWWPTVAGSLPCLRAKITGLAPLREGADVSRVRVRMDFKLGRKGCHRCSGDGSSILQWCGRGSVAASMLQARPAYMEWNMLGRGVPGVGTAIQPRQVTFVRHTEGHDVATRLGGQAYCADRESTRSRRNMRASSRQA